MTQEGLAGLDGLDDITLDGGCACGAPGPGKLHHWNNGGKHIHGMRPTPAGCSGKEEGVGLGMFNHS